MNRQDIELAQINGRPFEARKDLTNPNFYKNNPSTLFAVGTVLGSLHEPRWVALTVAFTTAASQALRYSRVEERRAANSKAVSELGKARREWMVLDEASRSNQKNIDRLIARVEAALEKTLPPPTATAASHSGEAAEGQGGAPPL